METESDREARQNWRERQTELEREMQTDLESELDRADRQNWRGR